MESGDVIAAVATAPGRGGIGVIRISGKDVTPWIRGILGHDRLQPRYATLCDFRDEQGGVLDQGIALFFPAPRSFTGESVLELQGHGGPAVLQLILRRCLQLGARLAGPGEFTMRAFLNDRLDLAQAESIADLIDASSEAAARSAVRSLQGDFSHVIHALVEGIVQLRMLVEATLDFPEEEGVSFVQAETLSARLGQLEAQLAQVFGQARQGRLLREGIHVVLFGRPNVGKSSLMNQLAGEDVSIVTPVAGTTRDTIRQQILLEGIPVHLIDTAGLRETEDEVERIGIERVWKALDQADAVIEMADATMPAGEGEDAALSGVRARGIPVVRVINKIDIVGRPPESRGSGGTTEIYLSAKTGEGVGLLREWLLETVGWQPAGETIFTARSRHIHALEKAALHLRHAAGQCGQLELFAEELRLAQAALNEITGEFTSDDLLGEIFSRFCIGK